MIIIKLKGCNVTDITSNIIVDRAQYYYETDTVIQEISFIFDDNTTVDFNFYDYDGCFSKVVGFFYGKDFSEITKDKFIRMIIKDFQCECNLFSRNEIDRIIRSSDDD